MPKVIYSMGVSLDGFIAGPDGRFDWAAPDEELHRFANEQTRELAVHLCGRGLYETMVFWETAEERDLGTDFMREFAEIWRRLPKIVFSSTLTTVEGNARLATRSVTEEVRALLQEEGGDIAVGGAGLAAELARADLIDEYRPLINPVVVGGGTRFFPALEAPIDLELAEHRTFGSRVVYLRYVRPSID